MIRNHIRIKGVHYPNDLPPTLHDQMLQYSDQETFFIPDHEPDIQSIYEISIKIDLTEHRIIHSPFGKTLLIDGIKNLKIIYTENERNRKAHILNMQVPYNTFIELPNSKISEPKINLYVLDAYFHRLDFRKIYSHTLYLLDISYDEDKVSSIQAPTRNLENTCIKDTFSEMAIAKESNSSSSAPKKSSWVDIDEEYL